jgi:DNA-directed RNA polymerase subunit RPC12/RpoP
MAPDYIFSCRNCGHDLFINKFHEKEISGLPNTHCPSCGEEGHFNWIVMGEGDFADYEGEKIDFE